MNKKVKKIHRCVNISVVAQAFERQMRGEATWVRSSLKHRCFFSVCLFIYLSVYV